MSDSFSLMNQCSPLTLENCLIQRNKKMLNAPMMMNMPRLNQGIMSPAKFKLSLMCPFAAALPVHTMQTKKPLRATQTTIYQPTSSSLSVLATLLMSFELILPQKMRVCTRILNASSKIIHDWIRPAPIFATGCHRLIIGTHCFYQISSSATQIVKSKRVIMANHAKM